ncbi:MAG: hypothetical protein R6V85_13880 [Polyangia bacterium]
MSEKLNVCKALAAMIRNHGEPDEAEVTFVANAALELGLTPEENEQVTETLKSGGDFPVFLAEIRSRPMRLFLFRRVVAATMLDEKVEDDEMDAIERTAEAFDFDDRVVEEYVDWMKDGIAWEKRGAQLMYRL